MKSIVMTAVTAVALVGAGVAYAAGEADAEKAGCLKCHAVAEKKKGPSFQDSAKEFKGKSPDDVLKAMKEVKSHKQVKASDDEIKGIIVWMQSLAK